MKAARFTGLTVGTLLIVVSTVALAASPETALPNCSHDISKSVEQARLALQADDAARDHAALVCMVEAVAALDARMSGLSNGTIAFDGQIYAPKGVVMTKPLAKEVR